jgi:phosphonate transport system substrate-binding protein
MILKLIRITLMLFLSVATVQAKTFVFTAIPDQDATKLQARFQKVADYLSKTLKTDVKFIPVKSYASAVAAFRNNQVQLAWFGGLSGVRARSLVPGSQAIAQGAEDAAFITYFIVNSSTGIKKSDHLPAGLKGKTFTFGSKGSTSGRLMPEFYLRKQFGEAPDKIFSRVGFSGNHSKTIALVESGAYQAGAVNYEVWNSELAAGKIDTKAVSVVWQTPPFPDYQWSIRGDVDKVFGKGFEQKVKAALLNMKDPALLKSFPRSKFIPASNADYAPVQKVGKAIGLLD